MDLKDVPIDGLVRVTSKVTATTANHRLGESGAFANFKDPATGAAGPRVEHTGLELVSAPSEPNGPPVERPTPACTNTPGVAGGSIAFEHAQYDALEQPGPGARITLVRTDGRVGAAGVPDPGFGGMPSCSTLDDEGVDMALQPDGRIVLLVAAKGVNFEVLRARLLPDGSPDLAFGDQGRARADPVPHDHFPRALAIQGDRRIVVAAQPSNAVPVPPSFGLLRFEADGRPDASFGTGGVLRVPFFGGSDSADDLLVQPDGRIVAAGLARSGMTGDIAMVRLMP